MGAEIRAHIYIEGNVQGVFYRSWTKKTAQSLNLTGWVKNLEDGRVEVVFEGDKSKIEDMVARCKNGSNLAKVSHIDLIWEEASGELVGFEIID